MAGTGIARLTARAKRIRKRRDEQLRARPRTVAECAGRVVELEERVRELEEFKNKPIVAIGTAVALAIAARFAGAV